MRGSRSGEYRRLGKACADCYIPITDKATRCGPCAKKKLRVAQLVPVNGRQRCPRCKEIKPLGSSKGGPNFRCKECSDRGNRKSGKRCADCAKPILDRSTRCHSCSKKGPRSPNYGGGRFVNKDGYARLSGHQDHPRADRNGTVAEHVYVMEQYLGRYLVKGEEVHHRNGVRDDNRTKNLELWSKSQPAGQRVRDKIAWAIEILELYSGYEDPEES